MRQGKNTATSRGRLAELRGYVPAPSWRLLLHLVGGKAPTAVPECYHWGAEFEKVLSGDNDDTWTGPRTKAQGSLLP
jgi:hypothetical protein